MKNERLIIELARPVETLLPGLPVEFCPGVLALLGRGREAAELAALVGRDILKAQGGDDSEDAFLALLRNKLLTGALLEQAERVQRGEGR